MAKFYLSSLYRDTRYHSKYNTLIRKHPENYLLQLVVDYRLVFGEEAPSMETMLQKVKAAGFEIVGDHYLDYLRPGNALEKVMVDDLIKLARVIRDCVGLSELMLAGYTTETGNALLKEVEYIAQGYEESESEG